MEDRDETFSIENALTVYNLPQLCSLFHVTFNFNDFVISPIVLCPPPPTSCSVMSPNGSSHTASSHIHIPKEYTSEYIVWGESGSVSRLRGFCMTSGAVQRREDGQPLNWPWPEINCWFNLHDKLRVCLLLFRKVSQWHMVSWWCHCKSVQKKVPSYNSLLR